MILSMIRFSENFKTLLKCTHCGMLYVGKSIIPLNLRMNIHRKGNSVCERSVGHYSYVCKNARLSFEVIEKSSGNGYENGIKNNDILEYRNKKNHQSISKLIILTIKDLSLFILIPFFMELTS